MPKVRSVTFASTGSVRRSTARAALGLADRIVRANAAKVPRIARSPAWEWEMHGMPSMQANHAIQPYDSSSSLGARVPTSSGAPESMWAPAARAAREAIAPHANVHGLERLASSLVGGMLLARGVATHTVASKLLTLVGSALVYRGISGHCHLYQALGIDTAGARDVS
jgi:hypothetical protein